ncbi:DUF6194 family protein [uncultured Flavobacterium sp.]|uniref:DUF6194 family protein n=1 Tax=uncultured Flavobacterium sp. TaxID=165435 RepID=UPI00293065D7|nr:DUF6194 family protein [uncultured Flavobacterium sp.]
MTIDEIKTYLLQNFEGLSIMENDGDLFFMHKSNDKLPFVTLISKDNDYDSLSNLNRDGFFRLNFPIDKETFNSKFGSMTNDKKLEAYMNIGIDFTQENMLLPHPTYGPLNWVCIVNPSKEKFEMIKQYLTVSFETL